jgi:bacterioferritin-associated ferredoxin
MVTRCVCFDISFGRLKAVAQALDIQDLDELRARIVFGEKCGLCLPFVAQMLESGATEFEIGFETTNDEKPAT